MLQTKKEISTLPSFHLTSNRRPTSERKSDIISLPNEIINSLSTNITHNKSKDIIFKKFLCNNAQLTKASSTHLATFS